MRAGLRGRTGQGDPDNPARKRGYRERDSHESTHAKRIFRPRVAQRKFRRARVPPRVACRRR
jgi:hypothetical protein